MLSRDQVAVRDRRCTADEAFRILTKMSQDSNRKLRDVATALVTRAANTPRPQPPDDAGADTAR